MKYFNKDGLTVKLAQVRIVDLGDQDPKTDSTLITFIDGTQIRADLDYGVGLQEALLKENEDKFL